MGISISYSKSPSLFWNSCFQLPFTYSHPWWTLPAWAFPQLSTEEEAAPLWCGSCLTGFAMDTVTFIYQHLCRSLDSTAKMRTKPNQRSDLHHCPEKGRGRGEGEMNTTTPSTWGHRGHVSQMGNESKGTFLEVSGQGELLFDYFNSARLPPSVGSLKDIVLFQ